MVWEEDLSIVTFKVKVSSKTLVYFRMFYYYDVELVHAFIFIIPCLLITLFKVNPKTWFYFFYLIFQIWTKLVAKSQAEILSKKLNEELVKLV